MNLKSIYKILFGAHGPLPGNVIDMAEHGRAGGDQNSQGYKVTKEVDESMLIDQTTANITYIGWARPGSVNVAGKADARWKIKRIDETVDPMEIGYAGGTDSYTYIWDDRSTYDYI
ncbi:hypothetical protein KO465_09120 [Candidatus Micrarchaeota archaeon]|jgi:hypothetical protein|nr:hypothetical protein [Candidatus Micrarchaeota archaeon]